VGAAGWVPYGDTGRQGLLSHGSFLGVDRKHADTSPTLRGELVRVRMMCDEVPPPPRNVDTDNPPALGDCKRDKYAMWKTQGCIGCHHLMDPIGHGLENFDRLGRTRSFAPDDAGNPTCAISGEGEVAWDGDGGGAFHGVAGLSDKLIATGALESCLVRQVAHYALGREMRDDEAPMLANLGARFRSSGHRFDQLLLAVVTQPGFLTRVPE